MTTISGVLASFDFLVGNVSLNFNSLPVLWLWTCSPGNQAQLKINLVAKKVWVIGPAKVDAEVAPVNRRPCRYTEGGFSGLRILPDSINRERQGDLFGYPVHRERAMRD